MRFLAILAAGLSIASFSSIAYDTFAPSEGKGLFRRIPGKGGSSSVFPKPSPATSLVQRRLKSKTHHPEKGAIRCSPKTRDSLISYAKLQSMRRVTTLYAPYDQKSATLGTRTTSRTKSSKFSMRQGSKTRNKCRVEQYSQWSRTGVPNNPACHFRSGKKTTAR